MSSRSANSFEITSDGIVLHCRLTPLSADDSIVGLHERQDKQAIKCHVRAVPEKGKANTALEKLIATWLDVPKSSVRLTSGSRSRDKTIKIYGDPNELSDHVHRQLQTF